VDATPLLSAPCTTWLPHLTQLGIRMQLHGLQQLSREFRARLRKLHFYEQRMRMPCPQSPCRERADAFARALGECTALTDLSVEADQCGKPRRIPWALHLEHCVWPELETLRFKSVQPRSFAFTAPRLRELELHDTRMKLTGAVLAGLAKLQSVRSLVLEQAWCPQRPPPSLRLAMLLPPLRAQRMPNLHYVSSIPPLLAPRRQHVH
jgi:hypothetical protein